MTVWICIIALYSNWDGASHTSMVIDNLATEADCQRVAAVVKRVNSYDKYPPRAVCVQVRKAATR